MNSYYELLGVPPHATEMEIRSAYGRDVLRLQESASDSKVAQFRAALDAAFATLVDPTKRSAYDETLAAAAQNSVADAADDADAAFRYARRGGLWFTGGALVSRRDVRVLGGHVLPGVGTAALRRLPARARSAQISHGAERSASSDASRGARRPHRGGCPVRRLRRSERVAGRAGSCRSRQVEHDDRRHHPRRRESERARERRREPAGPVGCDRQCRHGKGVGPVLRHR